MSSEGKIKSVRLSDLLVRLFRHVSSRRRKQFILMLGLTLLASVAEVVSLGAVVPFIGILTQPEKVFASPRMLPIIRMLDILSPAGLVIPISIVFTSVAVAAGGLRVFLLWFSIRFANATGADFSIDVYRRTLYQPYRVHVARSSSEIISSISQKIGGVTGVLVSIVTIASSLFLFLAILITLFSIDPLVATVSLLSFGIGYVFIALLTRYRLKLNSECIAEQQTQVVKSLQEGLGAIRDVLLDGTQTVYCNVYRKAIQKLLKANGENSYINQAPRYAMETLGMVLISALACFLSRQTESWSSVLPTLGALALGAQRLLPLLQLLYGNWSNVIGSHGSLEDVLDLLEQPVPKELLQLTSVPLDFRQEIKFENVHFRYSNDGPWVLSGINMGISKGARVGFIGSTGSGKSTLLDLLMALLEPTQGKILIDGRPIDEKICQQWQRTVAHVPQSIYLADATVAENIAFGVPVAQIDLNRVRLAAQQAQIAEFIENSPKGYDAFVGERGIRLSGGQRQRIGIARALYKQAKVLVFDEATSALDSATESAVMEAIERLNKDLTIFIIAHRITTLRYCDTIVQLERGKVVNQSSYGDLMKKDSDLKPLTNVERVTAVS